MDEATEVDDRELGQWRAWTMMALNAHDRARRRLEEQMCRLTCGVYGQPSSMCDIHFEDWLEDASHAPS